MVRSTRTMYSLLERVNTYVMRWARTKYKRLRTWKRFKAWWRGVTFESRNCSPTGNGCARTDGEDEKSGMTGDCHVPFRGSLGVKFPGATRLCVRCVDGPGVPDCDVRTVRG